MSMMNRDTADRFIKASTSWPFLISLSLLLLNDLWLKTSYPGFVSGKLSDFAGVYLVSFVLFVAVPRHSLLAGLAVCVSFALWKSPVADLLVRYVQDLGVISFGRVVDYSDLLSLGMVYFACGASRNVSRY